MTKDGTHILSLDNGYHLWSRTDGTGKPIKLLTLHGGPGAGHEPYERFPEFLNPIGVEVTQYDQLGAWYSDQPDFDDQANVEKYLNYDYYLNEVEEVRQKLGYEDGEFYLAGHSWGGLLAQEYALRHPGVLKGLIIISMIDNIDDYVTNINAIREKEFDADVVAFMREVEERGEWDNPTYQKYATHLDREYITRHPNAPHHQISTMGTAVYNHFQGDNEFVITGKLAHWSVADRLHEIETPTLLTFGGHESMPLEVACQMRDKMPNARLRVTPNAGHVHMVDDPELFFYNLKHFIQDVEADEFVPE